MDANDRQEEDNDAERIVAADDDEEEVRAAWSYTRLYLYLRIC